MVHWGSFLAHRLNPNRINNPGPTKFFRRRRILLQSAHYWGRRRNCYRIALIAVQRAMKFASRARRLRGPDLMALNAHRVSSASEELGIDYSSFTNGLAGAKIALDNHSLATLSIWEPRTFKALANFSWNNHISRGFGDVSKLGPPPEGVILRGMKK